MKNLLLTSALMFSFLLTSLATTVNPVNNDEDRSIFESETVSCQIVDMSQKSMITEVSFDQGTEDVFYSIDSEISFVQVYNAQNELEFQLPVGAKKVYITLDTFDQGEYQVIFLTTENEAIKTELNKK